MRHALLKLALFGALALTLLPTARAADAPARKLIIGINSRTAIYWPTYIAKDKGIFARNGIEPDIILDGSPVSGVQQLLGGSLEIAHPTLYVAVNAAAHGANFLLIGCVVNTLPYAIMAPAAIKSAADMKGKLVSLAFKGDILTLLWRQWLTAQGVQPGDIDEIYDAQATNRYAALASGHAQAALLNAPFDLRAAGDGDHRLLDMGAISQGYAMSAVAVRPDWLKSNGDLARAYLRAQAQGIDWLYDPAHRDEAIAILARDTDQSPAVATQTYDYYVGTLKPFNRALDLPAEDITKTLAATIAIHDVEPGTTLPRPLETMDYLPK